MSGFLGSGSRIGKCANLDLPLYEQGSVACQKGPTGDRSKPPLQRGEGGFADWVIVTIHALSEYTSSSYRALLDELSQMDEVVQKLGLEPGELPDFTTVRARYQELKMAVWRALLRHSADLVKPGAVHAIDATGFDCQGASRHYANRTNYRFKAVKTTALVDCENNLILDIICSIKRSHDTQIGPLVLIH